MDEIALLTVIRPDAPDEFGEPERGEVVCRLLAAAAGERAAGKRMAAAGRRRRARWKWRLRAATASWMTRRFGIPAAAAAATVATVAGVLVALPASGHGPSPERTQGTVPTAGAGLGTQDLTARPGQFVYTEQLVEGSSSEVVTSHGIRTVKSPPHLQRIWLSANGRRGMTSTQRNLPHGTWSPLGGLESLCDPADPSDGLPHEVCYPGYLTHLPDTVAGMRSYLLQSEGPNGPAAYRLLGSIENDSFEPGLLAPNASYALMYRAALTVKGVYRVRHATTIAGTVGIGVAACVPAEINKGSMPGFHGCPDRTELIFDATTYELIGVDHMNAQGKPNMFGDLALLDIAVVSKPGQLP